MSRSADSIASDYPLPVYNFRVDVEGTTMSFSEVSGISIERETLSYRHGLSYWEGEIIHAYRSIAYKPVTLSRGVVKGADALFAWIDGDGSEKRSVDVHLCDASGEPVVTWHIAKAVATKLDAPSFDPNENSVAVESLEILASGISVEHH
jgi:phage tail-like protein